MELLQSPREKHPSLFVAGLLFLSLVMERSGHGDQATESAVESVGCGRRKRPRVTRQQTVDTDWCSADHASEQKGWRRVGKVSNAHV